MNLRDNPDALTGPRAPAEGTGDTRDEGRTAVHLLATRYPRTALPEIYNDVVTIRRRVAEATLDAEGIAAEHMDHHAAALACGLSAWAEHDAGNTRVAFTTAQSGILHAVTNAVDANVVMWLRGLQSLMAYRAGWLHEALRYARLGRSAQEPHAGTARVWLHSLEALSQAALGDALASSAALRAAEDARGLARDNEVDAAGGLLRFDTVRQEAYEARARAFIPGAERRAIETAEKVVHAYAGASPEVYSCTDEMGAHITLALAYASLDEIDAVAEALRPVFRLEPGRRVAGLVSATMLVHSRLRRPMRARESRVRELQEEIEQFGQVPLTIDVLR